MAGLDPAIHRLRKMPFAKMMDTRVKPAYDGVRFEGDHIYPFR
jgi:hypothetical protein